LRPAGKGLPVCLLAVATSGDSALGMMRYQSGPSQRLHTVSSRMALALRKGQLRGTDPHIAALQLTSLLTAETDIRLYQQAPMPLSIEEIHAMVERAADTFKLGMEKR
ncbi:TetR family transcriptional regulator, partial [Pseudomonas syringae]